MALNVIDPIPTWKLILRSNFNRLDALANFLELSLEQREKLIRHAPFVLNVPWRLAQKMEKGNLDDPLFRQFVPLTDELKQHKSFTEQPVQDTVFRRGDKLLHKYAGRALLVCTSACVMHCRFCFRQNFPYQTEQKGFDKELEIIAKDKSIQEVILSGGDPLSLSDEVLDDLLQRLSDMDHVMRIRFHTRFPIGIPERLDTSFLEMISRVKKQIYFVLHINHPNEVDEVFFEYLKPLKNLGCVLLNQAVLLKGINDNVHVLKTLCEELANNGVMPYYLHQLDRVKGTTHFEVSEETGRHLVVELAKLLPGFAVPKYVREIPGEPNKTPL